MPALRVDGVRVQGSLEIVKHLERIRPEPALYPADPERRRAVQQAESWGESVLQPIPRRLFRFAAAESLRVRRWLVGEVEGMPLPGLVARINKPIVWVMCRKAGVTRDRVRADLEGLPALLDRVDALLDAGTIGGAEPNAADAQILSSIASLAQFADLAPLIAGRSAAIAAERLLPTPPGPVPAALPRRWLQAAAAAARRAAAA